MVMSRLLKAVQTACRNLVSSPMLLMVPPWMLTVFDSVIPIPIPKVFRMVTLCSSIFLLPLPTSIANSRAPVPLPSMITLSSVTLLRPVVVIDRLALVFITGGLEALSADSD